MALKGNQGTTHETVEEFFNAARSGRFRGIRHDFHKEVGKGHGCFGTRRYGRITLCCVPYATLRIGKDNVASKWWKENTAKAPPDPLSNVSSSVRSSLKPNHLPKLQANIRESRIFCIGIWTCCSGTMQAQYVPEMVRQL